MAHINSMYGRPHHDLIAASPKILDKDVQLKYLDDNRISNAGVVILAKNSEFLPSLKY